MRFSTVIAYLSRPVTKTGWDFAGADQQYRRAITIAPNAALAHIEYAKFLQNLDMSDSAMAETWRAVTIDPINSHFVTVLSWQHQIAGRFREADSLARKALDLDSTQWVAHIMRAKVALRQQRYVDALNACNTGVRVEGIANPFMLGFAGYCYGKAGLLDRARIVLGTLTEMARQRYVQRAHVAWARAGLGDQGAVLDELELSAGNREIDFMIVMHQTAQELWREPRYQTLLRRTKIDRYWRKAPVP